MARSAPVLNPSGIEQRPLIVIAQQADVAGDHQVDALARIRAIADDVARDSRFGESPAA